MTGLGSGVQVTAHAKEMLCSDNKKAGSGRRSTSSARQSSIPDDAVATSMSPSTWPSRGGSKRASGKQGRSWWLQLSKLSEGLASADRVMTNKAQKAQSVQLQ